MSGLLLPIMETVINTVEFQINVELFVKCGDWTFRESILNCCDVLWSEPGCGSHQQL